ncbi:hypothetical protein niasHS_006246 [Heterodera schachtii]|uniref:Uncharacterized protein n=1 Tax=Heterodera schachtii TaxID=97005 RepID=A0ABD2JT96_HETSC
MQSPSLPPPSPFHQSTFLHCTSIASFLLPHCLAIRRLIRPHSLSPPHIIRTISAWPHRLDNAIEEQRTEDISHRLNCCDPSIRPHPPPMDNFLFPVFIQIIFFVHLN